MDSIQKEEKLEELEKYQHFGEDEMRFIKACSIDRNSDIRYKAAELLAFVPSQQSEDLLILLLHDPEKLVRVNACDSAGNSQSIKVLKSLEQLLKKDPHYLVRGYAAKSYAEIINNRKDSPDVAIQALSKRWKSERSPFVKLQDAYALYVLGQSSYLNYILDQLNHRYYYIRCAAVNIIRQIVTEDQREKVKQALYHRLTIEKAYSVRENLERLVEELS